MNKKESPPKGKIKKKAPKSQPGNAGEPKPEAKAEPSPASPAEKLKSHIDDLKNEMLLQRADLDNARKRIEKQKIEEIKYAPLPLMRELITVLDNLKLALHYAAKDDPLHEGVSLALSEMEKIFKNFHLVPIKALGEKFDPALHEAVNLRQDDTADDGIVLEEQRVGYRFHDRIVRASVVVVNRRPESSAKEDAKPDEPPKKE